MRFEIDKDHSGNVLLENNVLSFFDNTDTKANIEINKEEKIVINVGKFSNVTIIERISEKAMITINIFEGAKVNYLLIDSKNGEANRQINLYKNASMKAVFGYFQHSDANEVLNVNLLESGANVFIDTVAYGKEEKKIMDLKINHMAPFTKSEMYNYAIASGNSKVVYNAVGFIEKKMNSTDALQKTRGIILSNKAHLEANPALLISEFDVKASHGATIGKISDDDLYYLMSRGITKEEAMHLIIDGFINPIIENISDERLKEEFSLFAKGK